MCGLTGIAGALEYKDEDAMQRMMLMNWFRGKHSTGLAAVRPSGEVKIAKECTDPISLFEWPKFKEALNGNQSCVFLGHARHATKGAVSKFNAHPFRFEHIVGAHNGTLQGFSQDDLEKEIGEKYPVDSMAIIAAIAAVGIAETVKHLQGSWAISWVDLTEGSLNFIRNSERPLSFATSEDGKQLFWASEWATIAAGLGMSYRAVSKDKQGNRFFDFTPDFHYKFDISALMKGEKQKPVTKKLEGKKPFLVSGQGAGGHTATSDPFRRQNSTTTYRLGSADDAASRLRSKLMMNVEGTEEHPYGGIIHRDEFEVWAFDGCSFCQAPIRWGDTGITIYERDQIVLCPSHSSVSERNKTRIFVKDLIEVNKLAPGVEVH